MSERSRKMKRKNVAGWCWSHLLSAGTAKAVNSHIMATAMMDTDTKNTRCLFLCNLFSSHQMLQSLTHWSFNLARFIWALVQPWCILLFYKYAWLKYFCVSRNISVKKCGVFLQPVQSSALWYLIWFDSCWDRVTFNSTYIYIYIYCFFDCVGTPVSCQSGYIFVQTSVVARG